MLSDIQASAPVILAGAFALCAWIGMFISFRNGAKVKRSADQLRDDREFATWAAWTYVSVVDREGKLFHCSIWELRGLLAHVQDRVWAEPKAAIIYESSPDDPDPYGYNEEHPSGRPGRGPGRGPTGPVPAHRTQETSEPPTGAHRPDERPGKTLHPEG